MLDTPQLPPKKNIRPQEFLEKPHLHVEDQAAYDSAHASTTVMVGRAGGQALRAGQAAALWDSPTMVGLTAASASGLLLCRVEQWARSSLLD